MLENIITDWGGKEVTAMKAYSDIFRLGEGYIQKRDEPAGEYKANPLGYWRSEGAEHGHYRILFEDTFEETLKELQEADFAIVNGISYFGRKNEQRHASRMYAMIFDLDGVTDETLTNFFSGAFVSDAYPVPNYLALSGHGVHLYYKFEQPVPLFPNLKLQLKELKYALTQKMWNPYTSTEEAPQMQGINQGFRVLGGKTKPGADEERVRVFEVNNHPFTISQLCSYVPDAIQFDEAALFKESKMTRAEAKEKYPEWYARVVEGREYTRKRWAIEEKVNGNDPHALYHWWLRKLHAGATYGHRYFCVMALAIYAVKCAVPFEELKKEAYGLIKELNGLKPGEPFTADDVNVALECYDERYATFPLRDIEKLTAISLPYNRRNGRPQAVHLGRIRNLQAFDDPEGNWRNKDGRPKKREEVIEHIQANPGLSVSELARTLGVSRTTIYKYRDEAKTYKPPELSEYDKMRLARIEEYQKRLSKL